MSGIHVQAEQPGLREEEEETAGEVCRDTRKGWKRPEAHWDAGHSPVCSGKSPGLTSSRGNTPCGVGCFLHVDLGECSKPWSVWGSS